MTETAVGEPPSVSTREPIPMKWEVHITGDLSALQHLARSLIGNDPSIRHQNNGYILHSRILDPISDSHALRLEADRILSSLSGVARVLLDTDRPLQVSHIEQVHDDGTRNIIIQPEPATARASTNPPSVIISGPDGTIVEEHHPADPTGPWASAALFNEEVAKALRLRNAGSLSWADLYRLYEVLESGAGGKDFIISRGWASETEITRFRRTANSVKATGDSARHGVESTEPPPKPMKLSEGRTLVDRLLEQWLNWLTTEGAT